MTSIAAFEIPASADAAFLEHWRGAGTLYRALRRDVALRFVAIGEDDAPALPFRAYRGTYEVVHEDGAPDGAEGTTRIEVFRETEADVLAEWMALRDELSRHRGYLGSRLHRGVDAPFAFVAVARWSSPLMFSRACREVAAADGALYQVVRG